MTHVQSKDQSAQVVGELHVMKECGILTHNTKVAVWRCGVWMRNEDLVFPKAFGSLRDIRRALPKGSKLRVRSKVICSTPNGPRWPHLSANDS